MTEWYTLIVNTIVPLVKPIFVKGQEEIGKEMGKEICGLLKKYFTRDKQKALLSNLEHQPNAIQNPKELKNELMFLLSTNDSFSFEVGEILSSISPKWDLLIGKLDTYRKFKHRIEVRRIKWVDSESDESYSNDIQKLEGKFKTICEEIKVVCEEIKNSAEVKL